LGLYRARKAKRVKYVTATTPSDTVIRQNRGRPCPTSHGIGQGSRGKMRSSNCRQGPIWSSEWQWGQTMPRAPRPDLHGRRRWHRGHLGMRERPPKTECIRLTRRAGMMGAMRHHSGRHFLQIPGPTNVPERVLGAMARPTIDHRGPEFARLGLEIVEGLKEVFQTSGPIVIYPSSGTGAWEAALVNTLSPGDKIVMFETGHFATLWRE